MQLKWTLVDVWSRAWPAALLIIAMLLTGPLAAQGTALRGSTGLEFGFQPNVGQGFITNNTSASGLGNGINGMSTASTSLKADGLSRPTGLYAGGNFRFMIADRYFIGLDVGYLTSLFSTSGNYVAYKDGAPLRSGGDGVKGSAQFSLQSLQIPLSIGAMVSFWEETQIYLGTGAGYAMFWEEVTLKSLNKDVVNFNSKSKVSGSTLFYKTFIELQRKLYGYNKENPLYLYARLTWLFGTSNWLTDQETSDSTNTSVTDLVKTDSVLVNLGGWRITLGATYYVFGAN